ncbi:hypothetical protein SCHPADRAFT_937556 [Schizopora paradoxa]|uniref:Uncharacterized protein n=1 Tax=Schizopora paradoxa TaxID=27342 RepID=A0A0H2RYL4_9AGAM|nr:hypothetical protein SCHPADRAFT_937556 [Schizopora paradoxa]
MVSYEELSDAVHNCRVSYPGHDSHVRVPTTSQKQIQFVSPGDAFLALIFLRLEVDVEVEGLGLQDLINDVRNPRFKDFGKRRWDILLHKLAKSDLRNASLIPILTNGTFFASRTFKRISDIVAFIREAQESDIQPYHEATYALPSLVLHLIADFKAGEVDDFMYNMLRLPPRRSPQQDLLSMSLVHKSWTFLFQSRARRIVHFQSLVSLQRFVCNPHCGPWIREIYYKPQGPPIQEGKRTIFYSEEEEEIHSRISDSPLQIELVNHWPLLAYLLTHRATNLRFLSISFSDIQRTTDSLGNLMNPRPCRGFVELTSAIGKMTQLEGLEIDLHDSLYHPHLFANLCGEMAKLKCLRALSIRGFEERSREPTGSRIDDVQDRVPAWMLINIDVPQLKLRTLELSIFESPKLYEWRGLRWILGSLNTAENVTIRIKVHRLNNALTQQLAYWQGLLRNVCQQPFPQLRTLRIQLGGEKFSVRFDSAAFIEAFAPLLHHCTSLTTLFVTFSPTPNLDGLIPSTVETLYLSYNFSKGEHSAHLWPHWDLRTIAFLETHMSTHHALNLVVIDLNCSKYQFYLRDRFPQTIEVCRKYGVALEFSDEGVTSFDQRMYNSLRSINP